MRRPEFRVDEELDSKPEATEGVEAKPLPKLSDGRTFTFRVGKTKDLRKAQRQAGKQSDDILYYLVADCVQIDGEQLTFEDLLELPIADFNTLLSAVQGEDVGDS